MKTILFSLICAEIRGTKVDESILDKCKNSENLLRLYQLSKKHDLSHLIGSILSEYKILCKNETSTQFQQQIILAVKRYEQKKHELNQISNLLEEAKISFVPLKGAFIQNLYSKPWLRTSCDLDILIRKEDCDKTVDLLTKNGYHRMNDASAYDYAFLTPGKVSLELHYSLSQGKEMKDVNEILEDVWNYCNPLDSYKYCNQMKNEMIVFYHVAHMAKHFICGGCGIRPFIDLYLLRENGYCNSELLSELLKKANLIPFYQATMDLIKVWFDCQEHSSLTQQMEEYVLIGGVYGTIKNSAKVKSAKGESKTTSLFKLIFLPRKNLEIIYPNLRKHPLLLPFYQVKRWFRIFNRKKRKHVSDLTNARNSVSKNESNSVRQLLEGLGLK